jgi:hypothetical protein
VFYLKKLDSLILINITLNKNFMLIFIVILFLFFIILILRNKNSPVHGSFIKKISDFTLKIRFFWLFSLWTPPPYIFCKLSLNFRFLPPPPYYFCKLRPNFKILPPKIFFSLFDLHEKIHSTIKVLLKL